MASFEGCRVFRLYADGDGRKFGYIALFCALALPYEVEVINPELTLVPLPIVKIERPSLHTINDSRGQNL